MRPVLDASRALLLKAGLAPQDCPRIIGVVMLVLNAAPVCRYGSTLDAVTRLALEVMTGIRPLLPIAHILPRCGEGVSMFISKDPQNI